MTLAAHPTWQELARAGATSPGGSCSGCTEGQIALGLFKEGHGFVLSGRDVMVRAAVLPHAHIPLMSSNTANPCRMLTNPSLLQAF